RSPCRRRFGQAFRSGAERKRRRIAPRRHREARLDGSEESINLLASFVGGTEQKAERRKSESAITAIALHADSAADPALEKFVDAKRPEEVRRNTAFWLGNVRGQKGYQILRQMVLADPSDKVREQCIFALHVSKVPQAVNTIIELARTDKNAHVRGQALFWLSQKAGDKAARAIADAIE